MMGYSEETGKIAKPDERTASKYITFLVDKLGKPKQAIDFIETNIDELKNSIVILSQLYYTNRRLSLDNWDEKVIEIADMIISNAELDFENRKLTFQNLKFGRMPMRSVSFINHMVDELLRIKNLPTKKGKEKKAISDKVGILLTLKRELIAEENSRKESSGKKQTTSRRTAPHDSDDTYSEGR